MTRLRYLSNRAKVILKTEGPASLLRNGFRFIAGRFFKYETHYLYETTAEYFQTVNQPDLRPKIDNITVEIVSTNEEADRLEAGSDPDVVIQGGDDGGPG